MGPGLESTIRYRALLHKTARIAGRSARLLFIATPVLLVLGVLNVLMHTYLHVCPLHAARFERSAIVPVVYGLPTAETFEKAARGEIVLGGCIVGSTAGVCLYCRWPAAFTHGSPAEVTLDDHTLAGLSPTERCAVREFVRAIFRRANGDEWVTAVSVTQDDVWVGTVNSGLHRLERKTGATASFRERDIGDCIHGIRRDGARVVVEHEGASANPFSREAFTTDRGRTWHPL